MSRRGWVLFISLSIIWGIPYLMIRVAVESMSPWFVVFARVAIGAAILLPIAAARGELKQLRGYLGWIAVFAVVEIMITWPAVTFAEQHLTSSFTALMISAVPLVAALIAVRLGLNRFTGTRLLGLFIGIAGVAALVGLDFGEIYLPSVVLLMITVVGYAFGPVVISQRLVGVPSMGVIAVSLLINTGVFAPFAIATRPTEPVPAQAWWCVVLLGVVCTAVAFIFFFQLVNEVGPARMTVITYLNPVVALFLGVLLLGEAITTGMIVGFPLVLIGSWMATRKGMPEEADPVPM